MILLSFLEEQGEDLFSIEYPVLFDIPDEELSVVVDALKFSDRLSEIDEIKVSLDDDVLRSALVMLWPEPLDKACFTDSCAIINNGSAHIQFGYDDGSYRLFETTEDMYPEADNPDHPDFPGPRNYSPGQVVIGEDFIERFEEMGPEKWDTVYGILLKAGYGYVADKIRGIISARIAGVARDMSVFDN